MNRLWILGVALIAGCAGTGDCGGNWRDIGQRDGRMGAGSHPERYAARCGPIDTAAYQEGYRLGFAQRPNIPAF
jgi:hypothetical protein